MDDWKEFIKEYINNIGHPNRIHQLFRNYNQEVWNPKINQSQENEDQNAYVQTFNDVDPIQRQVLRIYQTENKPNSKAHIKGKWYPEPSPENDGTYTIGYGIKLSENPAYDKLVKDQGGYMTDAQMEAAVKLLAQKHFDRAKNIYNKRHGAGSWDQLSGYAQSLLTDYSYNPGLQKFPKLMDAMHSGDIDGIRTESKRFLHGKELGRNKVIATDLSDDSLSVYSLFKPEIVGLEQKDRFKINK